MKIKIPNWLITTLGAIVIIAFVVGFIVSIERGQDETVERRERECKSSCALTDDAYQFTGDSPWSTKCMCIDNNGHRFSPYDATRP